ncbi:IS200/IS605 family transposase [Candidatus Gottesmanbacteria bacterium]|nr:IS200/IS605 family transposase [Candidatus Gottesmanbacteria bacterium]
MRTLSTGNARYSIWYHIVFLPKYRRKVLTNQLIEKRLKETLVGIANEHGFAIDTMEVVDDHVHLFLSVPPRFSPAQIVQMLKSITARVLRKEFAKEIKKYLWGDEFWCDGYFVSTINDHTTKDEIRKYIENQKDEQQRIVKYNSKQLRMI